MRDFDQTYRDYRAAVRRHAVTRSLNGLLDPEEIAQEAWLNIWLAWPKIREEAKPAGLILCILHRTATAMRNRANAPMRARTNVVPFDETIDIAVAPTQEDAVELTLVAERLDRIPPRERDVLIARALGDSSREIGDRLGVGREWVRQLELRARNSLTPP